MPEAPAKRKQAADELHGAEFHDGLAPRQGSVLGTTIKHKWLVFQT